MLYFHQSISEQCHLQQLMEQMILQTHSMKPLTTGSKNKQTESIQKNICKPLGTSRADPSYPINLQTFGTIHHSTS
jgi:hypothetical protein